MTPTEDPRDDDVRDDAPDGRDELELLLARVVDRTADTADWRRLESRADTEPVIWERLGRTLRDDGLLRGELAGALAVASRVELPTPGAAAGSASDSARDSSAWDSSAWDRRSATLAPVTPLRPDLRAWSGWAAALLLGLLWWGSAGGLGAPGPVPSPRVDPIASGGPGPVADAGGGLERVLGGGLVADPDRRPVERSDAATPSSPGLPPNLVDAPAVPVAYPGAEPGSAGAFDLTAGSIDPATGDLVVGELPALLLETLPAADGSGTDVVYVRRLVQRARVDHVYAPGEDELGRPRPVAVRPAVLVVPETL